MNTRLVSLMMVGALAVGCGTEDETDGEIVPSLSPVNLGKLWPQGTEDPDYGSRERVPYEYTQLLLANKGPVNIKKACLVGDQGTINNNWILETSEALPTTIRAGEQYPLRITFERSNPGRDVIALVIESDATNFPQLVIPVCGEVVPDGQDKNIVSPCEYTQEVPSGACD